MVNQRLTCSESSKGESKVLQCWQVGTWPSLTLQKLHKWDCMDYCDSDTVGTDPLMLAELTTSNNELRIFFFPCWTRTLFFDTNLKHHNDMICIYIFLLIKLRSGMFLDILNGQNHRIHSGLKGITVVKIYSYWKLTYQTI